MILTITPVVHQSKISKKMKLNFATNGVSNIVAFTAAAIVHVGIAAWSMLPSNPVLINRQAIQVSFVSPSASSKSQSISEKKIVIKRDDKNALKQQKNEKHELAENEKKSAGGRPTSGRVDPNSQATAAAESEPVFDAEYLKNPAPVYPISAKSRNIQGKVFIDVLVKVDGTPDRVVVSRSSGSDVLDQAALSAVKKWRFIPAKRGDKSVEASVVVPVEFKII